MRADLIVLYHHKYDSPHAPRAGQRTRSAVDVPMAKLSNYRYEEVCMSVLQNAYLAFSWRDIQRSHVKGLAPLMCALDFNYRNGAMTATWSVECNPMDSAMEGVIAEQDG